MRIAINALIIQGGQILLVRKNQTWILPGGKPIWNESDYGCLVREISEELSGTEISIGDYYGSFTGKTPHKGDELEARVYFAELNHELNRPSGEIAEAEFISNFGEYRLSEITEKVVKKLIKDRYIGAI
ncbi:MAG: NUDIX domain-containing protein [Candidatus Nanoarchaeia archaeon]|nr:NUDIX domain-containing protein [Candidatus Nanoarchaeia archaeon]